MGPPRRIQSKRRGHRVGNVRGPARLVPIISMMLATPDLRSGRAPGGGLQQAYCLWSRMHQTKCVVLASAFPFLVVSLAGATESATALKPIQVQMEAPAGCANAEDFFSSLLSRTSLVRQAAEGEPHTTIQVRLIEMPRYVLGELRIVDDRGETDARKVQGATCDDVVQAVALAAAVALDPSVLLPPTVAIPAPAKDAPASTEPHMAPEAVPPQDVREPKDSGGRVLRSEQRFELGAALAGSLVVSTGMSPGLTIFGRWTPAGRSLLRPTLGLAVTYFRNDVLVSPGAAQATLGALAVTLCATVLSGRIVTIKPCGLIAGGLLSVQGYQVVHTSSVNLPWFSAGAVARTGVHFGGAYSLDFEAGISAAVPKREFYTTLPTHVVERTPTFSPIASLGLAYAF